MAHDVSALLPRHYFRTLTDGTPTSVFDDIARSYLNLRDVENVTRQLQLEPVFSEHVQTFVTSYFTNEAFRNACDGGTIHRSRDPAVQILTSVRGPMTISKLTSICKTSVEAICVLYPAIAHKVVLRFLCLLYRPVSTFINTVNCQLVDVLCECLNGNVDLRSLTIRERAVLETVYVYYDVMTPGDNVPSYQSTLDAFRQEFCSHRNYTYIALNTLPMEAYIQAGGPLIDMHPDFHVYAKPATEFLKEWAYVNRVYRLDQYPFTGEWTSLHDTQVVALAVRSPDSDRHTSVQPIENSYAFALMYETGVVVEDVRHWNRYGHLEWKKKTSTSIVHKLRRRIIPLRFAAMPDVKSLLDAISNRLMDFLYSINTVPMMERGIRHLRIYVKPTRQWQFVHISIVTDGRVDVAGHNVDNGFVDVVIDIIYTCVDSLPKPSPTSGSTRVTKHRGTKGKQTSPKSGSTEVKKHREEKARDRRMIPIWYSNACSTDTLCAGRYLRLPTPCGSAFAFYLETLSNVALSRVDSYRRRIDTTRCIISPFSCVPTFGHLRGYVVCTPTTITPTDPSVRPLCFRKTRVDGPASYMIPEPIMERLHLSDGKPTAHAIKAELSYLCMVIRFTCPDEPILAYVWMERRGVYLLDVLTCAKANAGIDIENCKTCIILMYRIDDTSVRIIRSNKHPLRLPLTAVLHNTLRACNTYACELVDTPMNVCAQHTIVLKASPVGSALYGYMCLYKRAPVSIQGIQLGHVGGNLQRPVVTVIRDGSNIYVMRNVAHGNICEDIQTRYDILALLSYVKHPSLHEEYVHVAKAWKLNDDMFTPPPTNIFVVDVPTATHLLLFLWSLQRSAPEMLNPRTWHIYQLAVGYSVYENDDMLLTLLALMCDEDPFTETLSRDIVNDCVTMCYHNTMSRKQQYDDIHIGKVRSKRGIYLIDSTYILSTLIAFELVVSALHAQTQGVASSSSFQTPGTKAMWAQRQLTVERVCWRQMLRYITDSSTSDAIVRHLTCRAMWNDVSDVLPYLFQIAAMHEHVRDIALSVFHQCKRMQKANSLHMQMSSMHCLSDIIQNVGFVHDVREPPDSLEGMDDGSLAAPQPETPLDDKQGTPRTYVQTYKNSRTSHLNTIPMSAYVSIMGIAAAPRLLYDLGHVRTSISPYMNVNRRRASRHSQASSRSSRNSDLRVCVSGLKRQTIKKRSTCTTRVPYKLYNVSVPGN